MAVYVVTGRLGSGKSLWGVKMARDYMQRGRPVAANFGLDVRRLVSRTCAVAPYRLPGRVRRCDLDLLGAAYTGDYDESKAGLVVLDEAGIWLNARSWSDPERAAVLDWLLHSRKLGWDVVLCVQHLDLIDRQIREALTEYTVTMYRLDRIRVPLLGRLGRVLTGGLWSGCFPRMHLASVVYGQSKATGFQLRRELFSGGRLFGGYDTRAGFSDGRELLGGELVDMRATYQWLPATWYPRERRSALRVSLGGVLGYATALVMGVCTGRTPAQVVSQWRAPCPVSRSGTGHGRVGRWKPGSRAPGGDRGRDAAGRASTRPRVQGRTVAAEAGPAHAGPSWVT